MFLLTPQAKIDLQEILEYIASDNKDIALKVKTEIIKTCRLLTKNPHLGVVADHPTLKNIRYLTIMKYNNYLIFYRLKNKQIEIIRFSHKARHWIELLY